MGGLPTKPMGPPEVAAGEPKSHGDHQDLVDLYHKASVRPERLEEVRRLGLRILANKNRYEAISITTGVPWYVIGAIHNKEASLDFKAYLGNGERIIGTGQKSTIVPIGRGPFKTFEEGAIEALGNRKGYDWSLGPMLYWCEKYNGLGYRKHGIPSGYLWAATTVYVKGGFPRDHVWSDEHVVKNPGIAAVFKVMNIA